MSCLLTATVSGYSRVPEPPARMMPLRGLDCGWATADCGLAATVKLKAVRSFQSAVRIPQSTICSAHAEPLTGVLFRCDIRGPRAVRQIPVDRLLDARGERLARR